MVTNIRDQLKEFEMAVTERDAGVKAQYAKFKAKNPDAILMFRIGDFYEMFYEDAAVISKTIGLVLTQRKAGMPMCGIPFHQLDQYLRKMIDAGFRVAVLEEPDTRPDSEKWI